MRKKKVKFLGGFWFKSTNQYGEHAKYYVDVFDDNTIEILSVMLTSLKRTPGFKLIRAFKGKRFIAKIYQMKISSLEALHDGVEQIIHPNIRKYVWKNKSA